MKIEKCVLNDALRVLGKVVCLTLPMELYRFFRFVGDGDSVCAMVADITSEISLSIIFQWPFFLVPI